MFLDNASTTKTNQNCFDIIKHYNEVEYFNPSAMYNSALNISTKIENARTNILTSLGGNGADKFIFTSGATEANNMVINSVKRNKKGRFLFSIGEHPSVYNCAQNLFNEGYDVQFVALNKQGTVDIEDFKAKLNENVCFVSVMHVNNETGAINPIKELVGLTKRANPKALFHSDGVQAVGKIPVNVADLGVDFYTVSGHKLHAPKGIGGIYVKKDVNVKTLLLGGGQEKGFRSGTENVTGILSFEQAVKDAVNNQGSNYKQIKALNLLLRSKLDCYEQAIIISDENCSPYILSVSFADTRAETLLHMLDEKGYMIGTGSACSSKKKDNRILSAMGYSAKHIEGNVRISFSKNNIGEDIVKFADVLLQTVENYKGSVSK